MIPANNIRTVQTSGVEGEAEFGISIADSVFIMKLLRDAIYSDKVMAVLREYSANAWDAHKDSGKTDVPIRVTLPTAEDSTLTIRDFGKGLSQDEVFRVFTQYGASTKRNSASQVGMMGIGSKSAFAYTDSFTVHSYFGGTKNTYVALLDPSNKGLLKLLNSEPTTEETGIEIQIAIRPQDIREFHDKAATLFYFFDPRPEVNVPLREKPPSAKASVGEIYESDTGNWFALMGCIAYRVDSTQLYNIEGFDYSTFQRLGGVLYFNIGEVEINASREGLEYTDGTKKAIADKFTALIDEYVTTTLANIESGGYTPWEKRLKAQVLHRLNLPTLESNRELFAKWVTLGTEPPKTFSLQRNKNACSSISVDPATRLLLQDDDRNMRGFQLGQYDHVVKPIDKKTKLDDVEAELTALLVTIQCEGVKVEKLSTVPWFQPSGRGYRNREVNLKHRVKTFKLIPDRRSYYRPYSEGWETEAERDATDDDVFVILESFVPTTWNFYDTYMKDREIAKAFGMTMPAIYGYKSTMHKPVKADACQGMEYSKWRKEKFLPSLATDRAKQIVSHYRWSRATSNSWWGQSYHYYGYGGYRNGSDLNTEGKNRIVAELGPDHILSRFAIRAMEANDFLAASNIEHDVFHFLTNEVVKDNPDEPEMEAMKKDILGAYPLFNLARCAVPVVWDSSESDKWLAYVKLIDNRKDVLP